VTSAKTWVANGDVRLPITATGQGQTLVFFNGVCATQVIWRQVIGQLKGRYRVVTFDFRCHGEASRSADHSFEAFLSDAEAVMAAVGADRPIVVAWSFGADVAVAYAAKHPNVLGGLVIVDGAVPISDRLVQDDAKMRRLLNSASMKFSMLLMRLTPYRYSLSGDDIADLAAIADEHRLGVMEEYAKLDLPITMILATRTSVEARNNRLWCEGGDRLTAAHPSIGMVWLDAGHRLPLTKSAELANEIDAFASRTGTRPGSTA
jgi:esterase